MSREENLIHKQHEIEEEILEIFHKLYYMTTPKNIYSSPRCFHNIIF